MTEAQLALSAANDMRLAALSGSYGFRYSGGVNAALSNKGLSALDLICALRSCTSVYAVAGWQFWAYQGVSIDGEGLSVIAHVSSSRPQIEIHKFWMHD